MKLLFSNSNFPPEIVLGNSLLSFYFIQRTLPERLDTSEMGCLLGQHGHSSKTCDSMKKTGDPTFLLRLNSTWCTAEPLIWRELDFEQSPTNASRKPSFLSHLLKSDKGY